MIVLRGAKGRDVYYYDEKNMQVSDKAGNVIKLYAPINMKQKEFLVFWLDNMFKKLYIEQNEYKKLCEDWCDE